MGSRKTCYKKIIIFTFLTLVAIDNWLWAASSKDKLIRFLPRLSGWVLSEEPEFYGPENLFEYINGASEAYLSYDFQGLIVAFYRREKDKEPAITVEIYDLGQTLNAFGIYSSERPPEGNFIDLGLEGYLEQGTLHFLAGSYYVKVFSFLANKEGDETALLFGREIARLIPADKNWRSPLDFFPSSGLKPKSVKFILKNFLGFDYLHHGFLASYERNGVNFEAFIIKAQDAAEAEAMESRWKRELALSAEKYQEKDSLFQAVNKYFHNIYLVRHDSFLCGLIRLTKADDDFAFAFIKEMLSRINLQQLR